MLQCIAPPQHVLDQMATFELAHVRPARDFITAASAAPAIAARVQTTSAVARTGDGLLRAIGLHEISGNRGAFLLDLFDYRRKHDTMLALATKVVTDYGRVLAQVQPGLHGMPESLLPHSRAQIRDAIRMLLNYVEPEQTALRESLARGYVYLAQFVPDADAAAAEQNANPGMAPDVSAMRLMNRIKLDMERALEELGTMGVNTLPK